MSSVIGIDVGSASTRVAYIGTGLVEGRGVVEIVLNEMSQRSTPSVVAVTPKTRLYGDAAQASMKSAPATIGRDLKLLLAKTGAPGERGRFWHLARLDPASRAAEGDPTPLCVIPYDSQSLKLSGLQVLSMLLKHAANLSLAWTKQEVAEAVVAVPAFYTIGHREAVYSAAAVVGLPVVDVVNEHTAIALAYGFYRPEPARVAFVSMGHALFTVSVVSFAATGLTVLSSAAALLGGRDMDRRIMEAATKQFLAKHPKAHNPMNNVKARLKLEEAAATAKKGLSANQDVNLNIDCLIDDEDLAIRIKRSDFEAWCAPCVEVIKDTVTRALNKLKMSNGDLDKFTAIEIVGGATRTPFVQATIKECFGGRELSTSLNADEAVARGCALMAAIKGTTLRRVKEYTIKEKVQKGASRGISKKLLTQYRETEEALQEKDDAHRAASDARNMLEAKILAMPDGLSKLDAEDWLNDHYEDGVAEVYEEKHRELFGGAKRRRLQ
mmetsp:Transcript_102048/g.233752  ORF Transcript_102048/g.233752 Transcript_102048/m.233752 type:complete len:496 (+) Transcript_102048:26-1513(+)